MQCLIANNEVVGPNQSSAGLQAWLGVLICLATTPLTLPLQALDNSLQSKQVQEANLPEVAYQGVDLKAKLPEAAQPGVDLKGKLPSLQPVDGPIKAGRGQSAATALDDQGSFAQVSTSEYQQSPDDSSSLVSTWLVTICSTYC